MIVSNATQLVMRYANFQLCFEVAFRNHLQNTVIANGAEFSKDLTKSVTHLIAREPTGQKYIFATQWSINVVSVKWLTESLDRGMILDEALYHPLQPLEKQGDGAWNRSQPENTTKRVNLSEANNLRSRKLRRVGSTKLSDQNEGIWSDIVGKGFETSDPANREAAHLGPKQEPVDGSDITNRGDGSSISRMVALEHRTHPQAVTKDIFPEKLNGFLHRCYFFAHGFSPKEVSGIVFSQLLLAAYLEVD
jgi:DNA replication regulator DPB11